MHYIFTLLALVSATSSFALPIHASVNKMDLDINKIFANQSFDYNGIVKLDNCSGALIRFENAKDTDKGIILSNGHCVELGTSGGMIKPNQFIVNQAVKRRFQFLSEKGTLTPKSVTSTKIIYATMTGTDISMYELDSSYAEIKARSGVTALVLDSAHPALNESIDILSGYWQRGYQCRIDAFVYQLEEGGYFWNDSIRYERGGCKTIHGTSGSPILSSNTHKVIGINNTGNDNGGRCTLDNPCEHSQAGGNVYVEKGRSYGEQTYQIYSCLNGQGAFDLKTPNCKLYHK